MLELHPRYTVEIYNDPVVGGITSKHEANVILERFNAALG